MLLLLLNVFFDRYLIESYRTDEISFRPEFPIAKFVLLELPLLNRTLQVLQ